MLFANYIKSTLRNSAKNKLYTFINILGLSLGITAALLILLYIDYELSYDKHYKDYEKIYRLESDFTMNGKNDKTAPTPRPFGPVLKDEIPEIETFTRFLNPGEVLIKFKTNEFYEDKLYFTDSNYFDIFKHKVLLGSTYKALSEPYTIVLTKSMAKKYFGEGDPIGKFITTGSGSTYKVTAVIEDVPENSHLKFTGLLSYQTLVKTYSERFNATDPVFFWSVQVFTYIKLKNHTSIDAVYDKFPEIYDKYMASYTDKLQGASFRIKATRLDKIHLDTDYMWDLPVGNKSNVIIFSIVGLLLLLIASINYMNLATSRSVKRAREVGIRKVVGASRGQLVNQFITESLVLSVFALVIALVATEILLPSFNRFAGIDVKLISAKNIDILFYIIGITFFVGIFSGSFPAFFLSKFQAIDVIRGNKFTSLKTGGLRKVFVVLQFTISAAMLICTMIVYSQISYIQNKDLGFDKDNVINMQVRGLDSTFFQKIEVFRNELLSNPRILNFATANSIPGTEVSMTVFEVESEEGMSNKTVKTMWVDPDFAELMKMEMTEGKFFDKEMLNNANSYYIVNQSAVEDFGWTDNPIGKKIALFSDQQSQINEKGKVIGVINDFNFLSLKNPIEPLVINLAPRRMGLVFLRITGDNREETINFIEQKWKELFPEFPFDYQFVDQSISENYQTDKKLGKLFGYFSILTIIISLLGLFGLTSFVVEQKTKEISIRKVLGASNNNIYTLISKEFIILILISNIIACFGGFYIMKEWLANFAFATKIYWWIFPLTILITLIVALGIIIIKAYNVTRINPANTLKFE